MSRRPGGDLDGLRAGLGRIGPMVVAFSGGADSAFLAWVATDTLGADQVRCVTAVSPSLAPEELADCRPWPTSGDCAAPRSRPTSWPTPPTRPTTARAATTASPPSWRPWCRWPRAEPTAPGPPSCSASTSTTWATTVPASRPPPRRGARFPLVEAGFTKTDVRQWSRRLGLRTWDKPAAACLASRVPYGTPVTLGTLRSVAEAESALRSLGFTPAPGPALRRHRPHRGARRGPRRRGRPS